MPKVYSVGLAWVDSDQTEMVLDTDERARFMAYGPGVEVPDEEANKISVRGLKARDPMADKQRRPANKGGLTVPRGK